MITVYGLTCVPCTHKDFAKRAKKYAAEQSELIRFIDVHNKPEHRYEADKYKTMFPFAVKDGEVIQI